jgi:3'-phosphoadenosine 5'-phosphosulfate sulfotransferase (PAPS reductase)/FAD synthetase
MTDKMDTVERARAVAKATLLQRQCLPLDAKVRMTLNRIKAWYEHWDGDVYVAWSAGKDSTVLKELVWSLYPDVPLVFSNTGLEYPEIVAFAKAVQARHQDRVVIVRPKRTFRDVVLTEVFPVISKKVAKMLRVMQRHKGDPSLANTYRLYNTGIKQDGTFSKASRLPAKWRALVGADFKVSEKCCDHLKKEPLDAYAKETGRKRITGIMAAEGGLRAKQTQCNVYDARNPSSAPMLFWTEQDVWEYIRTRNVEYCPIYDNGESRTGCMFCGFGVHLEEGENRFQRMASSHPKQFNYCINDLGMGRVLSAIGVDYMPGFVNGQAEMFPDVQKTMPKRSEPLLPGEPK